MLAFSLVQPTPPSMLFQLSFSGAFGGGKNGLGFWRTRMWLPLIWVLIQFLLIGDKSCPSTHTFYGLF